MGQFYDEEKIKAMEAAARSAPAPDANANPNANPAPAPSSAPARAGGHFYDEEKIRSMESAAGVGGSKARSGMLVGKILLIIAALALGAGLLWWKASHNPDTMVVNLNKASATELAYLPGIGEAKAKVIISHRPYRTTEDLKKVPGIGDKTFEKLKDRIKVE